LDDTVGKFQPAQHVFGISDESLEFLVRAIRLDELDHLHLLELMDALDSAYIAAG
jgi:hypothetical protein